MPLLRTGQPSFITQTPIARSFASLVLAGASWAHLAYAQESGTTGAGASPAPAAPPVAPAAEEPATPVRPAIPETGNVKPAKEKTTGEAPGAIPGSGTGQKASPFALPLPTTTEERNQKSPFGRQNSGASSLFGTQLNQTGEQDPAAATGTPTSQTGVPKPIDAPTTFSASGFYGGGGVSLTTGTGRLAKPRQKWSVTAGMGFDDNTLQAPTDGGGTADQVFRQVVRPEQPEITQVVARQVLYFKPTLNGNTPIPAYRVEKRRVVIQPYQAEQVEVLRIPGIPDRERDSSVVSQLDASYQAQWAKGRQAFTMDARAGIDYYWSRTQDPLEYDASLSLLYIRKLSSRMQVSTALAASYQTQPDYNRLNSGADTGAIGATTSVSSKTDLSYRWNRKFSTVSSLTAELRLQEATIGNGSFTSFGLGQEFRYASSPRFTYVGEVRYAMVDYLDGNSSNDTVSLLAGFDWDVTRHVRATTRLGESIRTFQPSGLSSSSPYGELSLSYQPTRKDTFTGTSRYGFEESTTPGAEQLVFRTSLTYQRLFNPKFVGSASINKVSYTTKSESASSGQDVLDGSLSLRYFFTRKFKMGASYSYTNSKTDAGVSDYYRNRFFVTGEYEF